MSSSPSGPLTLRAWVRLPEITALGQGGYRTSIGSTDLVTTGIPGPLVQAWLDATPATWHTSLRSTRLANTLRDLAAAFPTLDVVTAARWAVVAAETEQGAPSLVDLLALIRGWPQALRESAWTYAAAGLSPVEVAERDAAGTLPDAQEVAVLAALRGVRLPRA